MSQRVMWSYGVTSCRERLDTLLPRTLQSLTAAGFDTPRLFVDGAYEQEVQEVDMTLPTTCHSPPLKTYGNWVLALAELYIREPSSKFYALFQDDILAVKNLRRYLEKTLYTERRPAKSYYNLYCSDENYRRSLVNERGHPRPSPERGWYKSNQLGRGALGLVFDVESVIALLTSQHMVERPRDAVKGWRNVDGAAVTALKAFGWTEYVHSPSLLQHTGVISSMDRPKAPGRKASSFPGEDWDALVHGEDWMKAL